MTDIQFLVSHIISGVTTGCIYGLLAVGMVFIYRAGRIGNFAQSEQATLSMFLVYSLSHALPLSVAILLGIALTFIISGLIHVLIIRKIDGQEKLDMEFTEMLVTIGLTSVLNGTTRWIWGSKVKLFPALIPETNIVFGPYSVSSHSVVIVGATAIIVLCTWMFFRFTHLGLACEAVAGNRQAAAARGIRIHHVLALTWGISGVLGALAGVLAGPVLGIYPDVMWNVFIYAYTACVIGGLQSAAGAMMMGIFFGIVENLAGASSFIGSELKTTVAFALTIIILYVKPRGIFGRKEVRKV